MKTSLEGILQGNSIMNPIPPFYTRLQNSSHYLLYFGSIWLQSKLSVRFHIVLKSKNKKKELHFVNYLGKKNH